MKKEYTVKQVAENIWLYTFAEPNKKGETLVVELSKCINLDAEKDKKSLLYMWHKAGCTEKVLTTFWGVETFVRDTEGACCRKYDPQLKVELNPETGNPRSVINFNWMLEATEENKQKLIDEVYRLFSSATGKTATEKKIEYIYKVAKQCNVDVLKTLPEGWKEIKGAMTAPCGSMWITNGKTIKSGERKQALLLI